MRIQKFLPLLILLFFGSYLAASTQAQQPSDTAGCCNFVKGNVDYDMNNQTDISDLVFLVDFFFSGKIYVISPIKCTEATDLDSDGLIDISDLVMLVEIIFTENTRPPYCIPNLNLNVDTRIKISMHESTDEFGTSLYFEYISENTYPNPCYTINTTFQNSEGSLNIQFDYIVKNIPDSLYCITIPGEASGSENLGQLSNGTYTLTLDNGYPSPFTLIVTNDYYKITGSDERQFIIDTPILYKAP